MAIIQSDRILNTTVMLGLIKVVEASYPAILASLLISFLGISEYGNFVVYFTISQILIMIINLGLDEYLAPIISRGKRATEYIILSFTSRAITLLILFLLCFVIQYFYTGLELLAWFVFLL